MDAIVEAAGVAKGTFYYHFQSIEELVAAVGEKLADSFDELLAPSRLGLPDPIVRMSFAFTNSWRKPSTTPSGRGLWSESAQAPAGFDRAFAKISRRTLPRQRPGTTGHTGRGAGGRYRHRYLAPGHARHS